MVVFVILYRVISKLRGFVIRSVKCNEQKKMIQKLQKSFAMNTIRSWLYEYRYFFCPRWTCLNVDELCFFCSSFFRLPLTGLDSVAKALFSINWMHIQVLLFRTDKHEAHFSRNSTQLQQCTVDDPQRTSQ